MKMKGFLFTILLMFILTLNLSAADVSYNLARTVALHKAAFVYGDGVSLGPGIPFYDNEDRLIGYEFGISLKGGFPSESQILSTIREKKILLKQLEKNGGFEDAVRLEKEIAGVGRYAHIFVSANTSDFPIPEYGQGLPDYYQRFDEAKELARDYLGSEPTLKRVYYLTPYLKWFLFTAQDNEVYISLTGSNCQKISDDIHTIRLEKSPGAGVLEKKHQLLWSHLKSGDFSPLYSEGRGGYIDSVPEYVWSYGCSPTASAMVMGYWDERGYDRLVDWYWNHLDPCENQVVLNMPNVQRELAIAMNTDTFGSGCGGTSIYNIAGGHTTVANSYNGYSFSASRSPQGYQGNDFVWSWITGEVNAGRPFNWSNLYYWFQGQFINHSVTGYGYTDDKYVVLFNTWGWGEQEWYYYTYHSGTYSEDWVITAVPGGFLPDKVTLVTPNGGEQWYAGTTDTIRWTTQGGDINHLKIYFSQNGGKDWQTLTTNASNTGSYAWNIQPDTLSTYRAKIRLEGFNSSNTLLGADGSEHDFTIYPQTGCTLYVTSPNGGEVWTVGEVDTIKWQVFGVQPNHVVISYSADGGNQWNNIITYPNTGYYNWTIPDDTTHSALVKVRGLTAQNSLLGEDVSDNFFTIAPSSGIKEDISHSAIKHFHVSVSPVPMTTTLTFAIQGVVFPVSTVTIEIIDISGRLVRHIVGNTPVIVWNGADEKGKTVQSGIYFYKVTAGTHRMTGKFIRLH